MKRIILRMQELENVDEIRAFILVFIYDKIKNKKSNERNSMKITKRELALLDEWVALHEEIEKLEGELDILLKKLKDIGNTLYARNPKVDLEEFRDFLAAEIKKLDAKTDRERKKQLSTLKGIIEHDINIDNLVEQDIDIEEKGIDIDLADYKK